MLCVCTEGQLLVFLLALANLHPGVTSHPEIRQAKRDFLRALAVLKRARF